MEAPTQKKSNKPDTAKFATLTAMDKFVDAGGDEPAAPPKEKTKAPKTDKNKPYQVKGRVVAPVATQSAVVEMCKFNVELPYELRLRIKLIAAEARCPMNQLVAEALQEKYGGPPGKSRGLK